MPFLPGLGEKIALNLTMKLLEASTLKLRKLFTASDAEKALQAAIAQALAEALASIDVPADLSDHYENLFEEFFRREEVVAELAQLLDPRPDVELDFAALTQHFETEHDSASLEHLDLAAFLRAFASAFYGAAVSQPELKSNLEMKLLGEMVKRTGLTVQATERTAAATEQMTGLLQKYLEDQNARDALLLAVHTARDQGMLTAFQAFEGIAAGMFKAGFDFGVGRTGLIEIGGDLKALPPAQADTIRTLAGDLRQTVLAATPNPAELDALEQRYRQHIIRWFENLQFQGLLRTPRPIVLPLEDVYVELRAVAEVPDAADAFSVEERRLLLEVDEQNPDGRRDRREMMSQLDALRRERWSRTLPERKSIAESLHQRDRRAFVILGDPGSGKTTLLHFLALVYARGPQTAAARLKIDLPEADRLPIFVPLAAFDDMLRESRRAGGSLTLLELLPRYYDRRRGLPGLEPLFRRALTSGRAVVLLDGLDEVIDVGTRTFVAEQAGALINEWSPRGVRFAVSSRFVGYREAPVPGNLPTLSVLDFGLPEIEIFVHRWAEAYEKWAANGESPEMFRRARTLETDLLTDVKSNESVRRLAANPLMITMLALLRRQVGRLPHRRVQLYESYVGALLENWVGARSQGAREQSVDILDRHQAENLLIPLALWLQQEKPSGTAGRAEIQQKLTDICLEEAGLTGKATRPQIREAEDKALRFLQEMRQMAGLLIERGHDAFGFLHLTFQEYFAGRALARLSHEERRDTVRPNRHDPRWREPILLCAGRLGVVENRRAQVTEFVRGILECPDDTEEKLHRNLLLALAIAGDDVNLAAGLVSEVVGRAVACLETNVYALARSLTGSLGQLVANGAAGVRECFGVVWSSGDSQLRRAVTEELGRFASLQEVRTTLLERLGESSGYLVAAAIDALSSQVNDVEVARRAVIDKLKYRISDYWVPYSAIRALAGLVEVDAEIRTLLLTNLELPFFFGDDRIINAASELIGKYDKLREAVLSRLKDPSDSVQVAAINALAKMSLTDTVVREAIAQRLADLPLSSNVWQAAVTVLAQSPGMEKKIRAEILSKLEAEDSLFRSAAIRALAVQGKQDGTTLSVLLVKQKAVALEDDKVAILRVIADFQPSSSQIISIIQAQAASVAWAIRKGIAEVLGRGARIEESLETVRELRDNRNGWEALAVWEQVTAAAPECLFESPKWRRYWLGKIALEDWQDRAVAVTALAQLVGTDQMVRREVLGALADKVWNVRLATLSGLSGMVGTDTGVRNAVLGGLEDENYLVRLSALRALSEVVRTDAEVRSTILMKLKADGEVRSSALKVLSGAVGIDSEVRRFIMGMLRRDYYCSSALNALAGEVVRDAEVRGAVLAELGNRAGVIRSAALTALSEAVETDIEVRRAVVGMLGDEESSVCQSALIALSGAVGLDAEVRRIVWEKLGDQEAGVRAAAIIGLSNLQGVMPEVTTAIIDLLEDQDLKVRLASVQAIINGPDATLDRELVNRLLPWLAFDCDKRFLDQQRALRTREQLASLLGPRAAANSSLRDCLFDLLREPRWSARCGAILTLLKWPGGPPNDILNRIFEALEDRRALEAYPAQLTAASFLINRNDHARASIDFCLEALDYGTRSLDYLSRSSEIREQAALVLGKLEPVFFEARIFNKLLGVVENDEDGNVRDAAYGTLVRLARVRESRR